MDNKLFKSFIDKVNEILASEKTTPFPLPPPPLLLLLLLLLLSLLSSFDYKLELKLKPLLAIHICSLLYLPAQHSTALAKF